MSATSLATGRRENLLLIHHQAVAPNLYAIANDCMSRWSRGVNRAARTHDVRAVGELPLLNKEPAWAGHRQELGAGAGARYASDQ